MKSLVSRIFSIFLLSAALCIVSGTPVSAQKNHQIIWEEHPQSSEENSQDAQSSLRKFIKQAITLIRNAAANIEIDGDSMDTANLSLLLLEYLDMDVAVDPDSLPLVFEDSYIVKSTDGLVYVLDSSGHLYNPRGYERVDFLFDTDALFLKDGILYDYSSVISNTNTPFTGGLGGVVIVNYAYDPAADCVMQKDAYGESEWLPASMENAEPETWIILCETTYVDQVMSEGGYPDYQQAPQNYVWNPFSNTVFGPYENAQESSMAIDDPTFIYYNIPTYTYTTLYGIFPFESEGGWKIMNGQCTSDTVYASARGVNMGAVFVTQQKGEQIQPGVITKADINTPLLLPVQTESCSAPNGETIFVKINGNWELIKY